MIRILIFNFYILGIDESGVRIGGTNLLANGLCAPREYPPAPRHAVHNLKEGIARGEGDVCLAWAHLHIEAHPPIAQLQTLE